MAIGSEGKKNFLLEVFWLMGILLGMLLGVYNTTGSLLIAEEAIVKKISIHFSIKKRFI